MLDLDHMLAEASRLAGGLADFGDPRFREPASVLVRAMNAEGGLSQAGVHIWRRRIVEMLRNRLVMEDYYRRYPEISRERILGPIVIVGLPRTGTTLLQRVLGCDRRFHPMLTWESRYPTPMVEPGTPGPDPRIAVVTAETEAILKANPTLLAIHPMSATEPDEEGMLMEHSFQSFFDAYADIPSYTEWMWGHDQTMAYEYLERMLRFLQWQKRRRGEEAGEWVLKTPHHLRQIDVLFKVFPGTRVIQTHRDPVQTVPSIASFTYNLWKVYMERPAPFRAGQQWSGIFARGVRETLRFRENMEPGLFHDVWFADTLAKPLEVVRGIYDWLGKAFPADTQEKMKAYLEANRREKRPLHEYTLDHYGLSEEQIRQDFAEYRARYIIPRAG